MIDNARYDAANSKYAMATLCNTLMNIIVLEPELVSTDAAFAHLLKFITNALPTLDNSVFLESESLVVYGNLSVLGLLVMKPRADRRRKRKEAQEKEDVNTVKFVQAVVR